jgi:filamentous hemagglutinin
MVVLPAQAFAHNALPKDLGRLDNALVHPALAGDKNALEGNFGLGQSAGENAVKNNYLKFDEIKRKEQLEAELKACGNNLRCSEPKLEELQQIAAADARRDQELADCKGKSTSKCQQAYQEVRTAAAELVRKAEMPLLLGADGKHTVMQSTETLNKGTLLVETGKGAVSSVVDGWVNTLETVAQTVSDPSAAAQKLGVTAQQAQEALAWAAENPDKYEAILQQAQQDMRERAAAAIEAGNAQAYGAVLGEMLAAVSPDPVKKLEAASKIIDRIQDARKQDTGLSTGVGSPGGGVRTDAIKALGQRADIDGVIQAPVGSKGNWDPSINTGTTGVLEPRKAYVLDNGHAYITDSSGRVKEVTGNLSPTTMDRNTYQQGCAGKSGCAGDDGGHLIASSLGGAGDRINIVPQAATLNRDDWRAMERELAGYLKEGKSVSVKIDVGYPASGGVRPNSFEVTINVNGKTLIREFEQ